MVDFVWWLIAFVIDLMLDFDCKFAFDCFGRNFVIKFE